MQSCRDIFLIAVSIMGHLIRDETISDYSYIIELPGHTQSLQGLSSVSCWSFSWFSYANSFGPWIFTVKETDLIAVHKP